MLLDLSHTSHTRALTGIQRVARGLWQEIGARAEPICHDPYARAWRPLEAWELANLASAPSGQSRGAHWPLRARLRGLLRRTLSKVERVAPNTLVRSLSQTGVLGAIRPTFGEGLLIPEIFSPDVAAALPALFAAVSGPRTALFFDAVALKYPEMTPAKIVARYPAYLCELLAFDGIAAISADARDTLLEYWRWLEVKEHPPVVAIPLGVDNKISKFEIRNSKFRVVLSVGSLEGRKNHLALLDACETLWAAGMNFKLQLIGAARPETGRAALARIAALQAAGRPLRYDGVVDDPALEAAYAACAFTVYPSLMEGFGLPVSESLVRGKPCICSGRGALGESARGGGCVALDEVDAPSLAAAISRLLTDKSALERLSAEARARKFKSAADYARELSDWMVSLPSHPKKT